MNAHVTDDDDNSDLLGDVAGHISEQSTDEGSDSEESHAGEPSSTRTRRRHPGGDGDPAKARLLEHLQSQLHSLTLEAETVLSRQPRSTQTTLAAQTKGLFDEYKHYGSMARLKVGIEKFFKLGDEKGKVCFEKEEREEDKEIITKDGQKSATASSSSSSPAAAPEAKRPAHYGEAFMLNGTEDDDKPKFDAKLAFPTTATRIARDPETADTETDTTMHPLRTTDPDSVPYVTTLPWDPIATKVSWPDDRTWPRGLLGNMNTILSVEDAAARERLFHHVSKYGPAPVFRVGIAEHLRSEYATVFESGRDHYLGLTPDTRTFLRGVYRRQRHINRAERRLLALACRVAQDSVQMFWEDATDALRGYDAMRIFMAAREVERDAEARKSQADRRRADVLKEHIDRFNRGFGSAGRNAGDSSAEPAHVATPSGDPATKATAQAGGHSQQET
ncbi:hypothetical protein Z517_02956 [Fonsecaea pedrosoi CBS 271.37]|uniref:Uncharacterized protein n=1 Tax=Fonsecaea pedrosoi CBS 271.37 TaxID=1442368 RepID=A0A0D2GYK6_9EURO|nr:uncharacterized protein Z517_02956 [Fonsecaea pedrosoi CBS 271.37]KIW83710.1 hypothetical protein Z517_02956 [Fonsecaea pedrosoi CBS 271.37]